MKDRDNLVKLVCLFRVIYFKGAHNLCFKFLPYTTAECSGSLDIYNGAGEICWLNGMQHSINYGPKFVFVFQYSCGRFFSEKKKKRKKM